MQGCAGRSAVAHAQGDRLLAKAPRGRDRVAVLRREAPVRWRGHGHLRYLRSMVYCLATSGRNASGGRSGSKSCRSTAPTSAPPPTGR